MKIKKIPLNINKSSWTEEQHSLSRQLWTKVIVNSKETYVILFNAMNGHEILEGLGDHTEPFGLEFPSLLDIGVMGHCQNGCENCYQGRKKEPHMSFDDFKVVIKQSAPYITQCALGGRGDPNDHPDFERMVAFCRKNNIAPTFTTSGFRLTDEQITTAKKYCPSVAVSDYGQPETYSALNRLMKANVKTSIQLVLDKLSFPKAVDMLHGKDVWDGKIDLDKLFGVTFLLYKPQGCGRNKPEKLWRLNNNEFKIFAEAMKHQDLRKFVAGMDPCLGKHVITQYGELSSFEKITFDFCCAGRKSCYITPDLRLVPCSIGDHVNHGITLKPGKHLRRTMKDVWANSEPFNLFRKILRENNYCCPLEVLGEIQKHDEIPSIRSYE